MNDAQYIGLDVHQPMTSVAVLDSAGKLVMEAILETKAEMILQFLRRLRDRRGRSETRSGVAVRVTSAIPSPQCSPES